MIVHKAKTVLAYGLMAAALISPCRANALPDGGIKGKVTDPTNAPIPNVGVRLIDASTNNQRPEKTTTDENGFYQIEKLPRGGYHIIFEGSQAHQRKRKMNQIVEDDKMTEVNVTMEIISSTAISGVVADLQGAVFPNTKVTARNIATGEIRTTTTNEEGEYILDVPAGDYEVKAEVSGFKTTVISEVAVSYGQSKPLDITLELGTASEQVVVTANSADLSEGIGLIIPIPSRLLILVPLNVATLPPGLTLTQGNINGIGGVAVINGQRASSSAFVIDGIDIGDISLSAPSFASLPLDAVQEISVNIFRIEAEYGRYSGGVISAVTRSGSNGFHGSAFYSHRNSSLGARDFFDLNKSPSLRHNFGFTLGGPVKRDRAFFFASYEGTREVDARPRLVSVPSSGGLSRSRTILKDNNLTENPLSAEILRLFPSPDRAGEFDNLTFNSPAINDPDSFVARINRWSDRDDFHVRYRVNQQNALFPAATSFLPGFRTDFAEREQAFLLSYVRSLSPNKVNETKFLFKRIRQSFVPEDIGFNPRSLGLNTGVTDPQRFGLPLIKITGFDTLGSPFALPSRNVRTHWAVTDDFKSVVGTHSIKFGFDFRRLSLNSRNDSGTRGRIVFDGSVLGDPLADFLAGLPSGNTAIVRGDTQRGLSINSINGYVQDEINLHPNVRALLGLRYEFNGVVDEERNRLSNFLPGEGGLLETGSPRLSRLYKNDLNNFAPRIGVRWDVSGKDKFLIRGGWGIFYDSTSPEMFAVAGPFTNSANSGLALNPAGSSPAFALRPSRPIPFGPEALIFGIPSAPKPPFDIFAVEQNLRTPYQQKLFLGIQSRLPGKLLLNVSYVGAWGRKLYRVVDFNQPTPGDPDNSDSRRPFFGRFPQFRTVNQLTSNAESSYNALNVILERSFRNGFYLRSFYSFSKSIDDASSIGTLPQDSRNLRAERALSDFDQRHRFAFSWVYAFPYSENKILNGWQVSGIFRASTGTPFNPLLSFDNSGTGMFMDRPDFAGTPRPSPSGKTQLFTGDSFRIPRQGALGNASRNSLVGPSLNNLDLSVRKKTIVGGTGERNIEISLDVFNFFNHPNFSRPYQFLDEPAFGQLTATDPFSGRRRIQVGLRFSF